MRVPVKDGRAKRFKLVPVEAHASTIAKVFADYASGKTAPRMS